MRRHQTDRPRLLLVDDDPTYCSVLARALGDRGFDVLVAEGGQGGAQLIDRWMPPFGVFDLRLPDMSGLNLVARLKDSAAEARIVVLTGYGSGRSAARPSAGTVLDLRLPRARTPRCSPHAPCAGTC